MEQILWEGLKDIIFFRFFYNNFFEKTTCLFSLRVIQFFKAWEKATPLPPSHMCIYDCQRHYPFFLINFQQFVCKMTPQNSKKLQRRRIKWTSSSQLQNQNMQPSIRTKRWTLTILVSAKFPSNFTVGACGKPEFELLIFSDFWFSNILRED